MALDANDPRSTEQKSQADAAIKRDSKAADSMEKARLKEEAALLKARQPAPKPKAAKEPAAPRPSTKTAKNKKPSDYFVAVIPGEKNQKTPKRKKKPQPDRGESR